MLAQQVKLTYLNNIFQIKAPKAKAAFKKISQQYDLTAVTNLL